MFENLKIKKVKDINFNDLESIVSQYFGKNDLEYFLNKYSSEKVSMELGENKIYRKEYWLKEYEHGNIFVLQYKTRYPALTYTNDGYKIIRSNSLFFNRSLEWLIQSLRPTTTPVPRVQIEKAVKEIYEPFITSNEIIKDNIFDEEIIFKTNNEPIKDYPYLIELKSGEKIFGLTNSKGKISRYSTGNKKQILYIYHGDEALYRNGDLA